MRYNRQNRILALDDQVVCAKVRRKHTKKFMNLTLPIHKSDPFMTKRHNNTRFRTVGFCQNRIPEGRICKFFVQQQGGAVDIFHFDRVGLAAARRKSVQIPPRHVQLDAPLYDGLAIPSKTLDAGTTATTKRICGMTLAAASVNSAPFDRPYIPTFSYPCSVSHPTADSTVSIGISDNVCGVSPVLQYGSASDGIPWATNTCAIIFAYSIPPSLPLTTIKALFFVSVV